MQTNKIHWASLSILVFLGLGASLALLAAFGIGINSLITLFSKQGDAAGLMITAVAIGFEGVVLLFCCWFVLQKTLGSEQAGRILKFSFEGWQVAAAIGLVVISLAVGAAVVIAEVTWLAWLTLPILTVAVIVPPIWLFFGIGSRGIELGPRWRVFSMLGLGMTLSTLIMIVLEVILLLVGIIIVAVFLAMTQPDIVKELDSLNRMLQYEVNEEVILQSLAPYIVNPVLIFTTIGYISIAVPLIEELFKPLAVWLFARELESPAQGFVLGLLSGAAFALVESLNASGGGTETWVAVVSVRAGTSMLHVMTSGLMGWGIASAFRERRILRLAAAYFSAVLIHGIWNACAGGVVFAFLGSLVGKPEWLFNIMPAATGGMAVLAAGMFTILFLSNNKIKGTLISKPPSPAAITVTNDATPQEDSKDIDGSRPNDGVQ
jgi:hypothetical protein